MHLLRLYFYFSLSASAILGRDLSEIDAISTQQHEPEHDQPSSTFPSAVISLTPTSTRPEYNCGDWGNKTASNRYLCRQMKFARANPCLANPDCRRDPVGYSRTWPEPTVAPPSTNLTPSKYFHKWFICNDTSSEYYPFCSTPILSGWETSPLRQRWVVYFEPSDEYTFLQLKSYFFSVILAEYAKPGLWMPIGTFPDIGETDSTEQLGATFDTWDMRQGQVPEMVYIDIISRICRLPIVEDPDSPMVEYQCDMRDRDYLSWRQITPGMLGDKKFPRELSITLEDFVARGASAAEYWTERLWDRLLFVLLRVKPWIEQCNIKGRYVVELFTPDLFTSKSFLCKGNSTVMA
ncbi:hypothetical protein BJ508DRAFT_335609 [Ascobolus immersus RN42]|uniref:Uncharacterized protein n=1 Tax=Ascobolus immersus RN42 TaxID=1160509 RepID=A0A3N4HG96_ASCIM|nr:hypothetical protein BJ508DRAFT_335609 [Ascobolus immersus RN42]